MTYPKDDMYLFSLPLMIDDEECIEKTTEILQDYIDLGFHPADILKWEGKIEKDFQPYASTEVGPMPLAIETVDFYLDLETFEIFTIDCVNGRQVYSQEQLKPLKELYDRLLESWKEEMEID